MISEERSSTAEQRYTPLLFKGPQQGDAGRLSCNYYNLGFVCGNIPLLCTHTHTHTETHRSQEKMFCVIVECSKSSEAATLFFFLSCGFFGLLFVFATARSHVICRKRNATHATSAFHSGFSGDI